jgi:Potential Queuosine, Q, salvage protein family
MPFFDDKGFFKRARITANDLVLAGVASFADVDRLTVFADSLLPHVLRLEAY